MGVLYPFKKRQFDSSAYKNYVVISVIVVTLALPFATIITSLSTGGYVIDTSPPSLCFARNYLYGFLLFLLPISINMGIVMTVIILLLYIITAKVRAN